MSLCGRSAAALLRGPAATHLFARGCRSVCPIPYLVMAAGTDPPAGASDAIWLGSGSKSRLALMEELVSSPSFHSAHRVSFRGKVSADIDEKAIRCVDPKELVLALAHAKADAILGDDAKRGKLLEEAFRNVYLVTCDQVVVHKGAILEKPESEAEARAMIRGYADAPAMTVGSTVVTDVRRGLREARVDVATIRFVEGGLKEEDVSALIEEGEVFWCAGGLMVEHERVEPYVAGIEGGIDSVMGLRKDSVVELLESVKLQADV
jgi:septum formation protein